MASTQYDDFLVDTNENGSTTNPHYFKNKRVLKINDSNNGSYTSGQIQFDLQQLQNSSSCPDFKSSYIQIPIDVKITSIAGTTPSAAFDASFDVNSKHGVCFKGSNYSLINSLTLNISNNDVVSTQPLSNIPIHYKLLTSWNENDVKTMGKTVNFGKDNTDTIDLDTGIGEVNNDLATNTGRLLRSENTLMVNDPTYLKFNTLGALRETRRSNCTVTASVINYEFLAIIPLRYLHDIFEKMPMTKGAIYRLTLNTHCPSSFTVNVAATTHALSSPVVSSTTGYIPFMNPVFSDDFSGGCNIVQANATTVKTELTIRDTCVFNAVMYEMEPVFADNYFRKSPIKTVKYEDFISVLSLKNTAASATISQYQLTAGLSRLRRLLIVPVLSSTATTKISPLLSAHSSCGMTTAPFAYLADLNVSLSGQNLFQQNITYRYDQFLLEQFGTNAIDGNGSDGLRTGLINEYDFNTGYGYVNINLDRKLAEEDMIPKSVSLSFKNLSSLSMDYLCYIFYEKEFNIDASTGQLVI